MWLGCEDGDARPSGRQGSVRVDALGPVVRDVKMAAALVDPDGLPDDAQPRLPAGAVGDLVRGEHRDPRTAM